MLIVSNLTYCSVVNSLSLGSSIVYINTFVKRSNKQQYMLTTCFTSIFKFDLIINVLTLCTAFSSLKVEFLIIVNICAFLKPIIPDNMVTSLVLTSVVNLYNNSATIGSLLGRM